MIQIQYCFRGTETHSYEMRCRNTESVDYDEKYINSISIDKNQQPKHIKTMWNTNVCLFYGPCHKRLVLHHWSFTLQWRHVRVIRVKSLATRQLIQTNNIKNINHWPSGRRDLPLMRKAFPCHDVIMWSMQSRRSCRRQEKVSLLTPEAGWRWLPRWILTYSPRTKVALTWNSEYFLDWRHKS